MRPVPGTESVRFSIAKRTVAVVRTAPFEATIRLRRGELAARSLTVRAARPQARTAGQPAHRWSVAVDVR